MDNRARFYKGEMERVLSLLNDGDEEKAVDLLFELRLKHDLSLYLRAWANLMLGRLLPHKAKAYHQEAIDLIEEMKACGITEACQSDVRELAVEEQALLRDIKSRSEESSEYDEIEGAAADNDEDGESIDLATLSLLDVPVEGPANIEGVFGKVSAKADSGDILDAMEPESAQMSQLDQSFADTTLDEEPPSSQTTAGPDTQPEG